MKEKKKNEFPSKYDFIGFDCTLVLRVKVGLPVLLVLALICARVFKI